MFLELAERWEAATGPDRDLDLAVAKACGWYWITREPDGRWRGFDPNGSIKARATVPWFSRSLDVVVTLVPKNWTWVLQATGAAYLVECVPPERNAHGFAENPILALGAAAMRARALL